MKKIVIAMLLILPLIIVATVLVATNIISNEAYIAVEGVKLNVPENETVVMGLSEEKIQLQATVYPTSAKNRSVKWKLENIQCFGDEIQNPVTISSDGLLTFNTYCTFDVVVTTLEASKRARANFYVKCDRMEGVSIFAESDTIRVGEKAALKAVFEPLDAEADEAVWSSSDEGIINIDRNGIMTAKSVGSAIISVTVDGEFSDSKTINITSGVTKFGQAFATSQNSFEVALLGVQGEVSVVSGGNISEGVFTFSSDKATLNVGAETIVITKCGSGEIEFENLDYLSNKSLAVGKLPIYLNVIYKDVFVSSIPEATFSSSDGSRATVNSDGQVIAVDRGEVTISANASGQTISLDYFVIKPVNFIRLNTVDGDDKRGIAENTVYGTKVYKNGVLSDFVIPISIQYPTNAVWEDYELSVEGNFATISGTQIIINGNVAELTKLTISVTAKYSAYESMSVRAKRNIYIVDGVNCYNYSDMKSASENSMAIMVHENIEYGKTDSTIELKNDFYGNGYMIDATKAEKTQDTIMFNIVADNVTVSNTQWRSDDIVNINKSNGLRGFILAVGEINQEERFNNITVEYSIFENGYHTMDLHNSDVYVNGCILRNTSNFGISLPTNLRKDGECDYTNLTMNNCVMSNIVATAIGVSTNAKMGKNRPLPDQSNFYSHGFLDIYNWQDITSMRMLDREIIPGDEAQNNFIKNLISTMLKSAVKSAQFNHIRVTQNDTDYIHLAIVTAGAFNPNTSIIEIDDERFITLPLEILNTLGLDPCVLYLYDNTANIQPDTVYFESEELYARLRGEN